MAGLPVVLLGATVHAHGAARQRLFGAVCRKPVRAEELRDALIAVAWGRRASKRTVAPRLHVAQRPLRILLAEDNPINQKVGLKILEKLGYDAEIAENGLEVLAAVETHAYDLILMDVQMPEMDGLDATRAVRQRVPRERLPRIVALTANARPEDRNTCMKAGMDDFLTKPLAVRELAVVLDACAARPPARATLPEPFPTWPDSDS